MSDSFFEPDGDLMVPTRHAVGPWDPGALHAGPPSGLLGRALEACEAREGHRIVRFTAEILGPVPLAPMRVAARVVRPGRSVEYLEATLSVAAGPDVMRASAWRMRTADLGVERFPDDGLSPPPPAEAIEQTRFWETSPRGYLQAMEWRFTRGDLLGPGAAGAWMRMRYPLVPGEDPSPLTRVLVAADSGNGISNVLDPASYLFVNTDLTVHLRREPAGVWVHLDAVTAVAPDGTGVTETVLWDEHGRIGRGMQSLLVAPRGA